MGYLGNQLATVVTGAFAAVLTVLWPIFIDFAPILDFVFIMAVPITWFLTFTCWISQKSADYMHSHAVATVGSGEVTNQSHNDGGSTVVTTKKPDIPELQQVQKELTADLNELKESLKLKDSEIERLNRQIDNLQTLVQIETLKTELANLKMLASKQKK